MEPLTAAVIVGGMSFAYLGWVVYLLARLEGQSQRIQHDRWLHIQHIYQLDKTCPV